MSEFEALTDVGGVNEARAETLRAAGYRTVEDLRGATKDQLAAVGGIRDALAARIKADVGDLRADPPPWLSPLSDRIGPEVATALDGAGYSSIGMIATADAAELQTVDGIGEPVAEDVLAAVEEWMDDPAAEAANTDPDTVRGIGPGEAASLSAAGYHSVADLQGALPEQIAAVPDIGDALAGWVAIEAGSLPVAGVEPTEDLAKLIVDEGVTPGAVAALSRTGYQSLEAIASQSPETLSSIDGIANPVAEAIVDAARARCR